MKRIPLIFVVIIATVMLVFAPNAQAKGKKGSGAKPDNVIKADVLAWLLANNEGLKEDFLKTENPDKTIKLPDGSTQPIYKLKQFLDVNFRITYFARKAEKGSDIVPVMEERERKLLATPEFRQRVLTHKPEYKINRKKMSAESAYQYIRKSNRHLGVAVHKEYHAPNGGGGGIGAPSWAVWKAMNIFWHETCHCLNINHDSGGISGPIAGTMRDWDRKKLWNYQTVDLNAMKLPETQPTTQEAPKE